MAIKLDEERNVFPAIKFENAGDYVSVAVVRIETIPLIAYGSDKPVIGADGLARNQTRLTGIVIGGNGVIREDDTSRPAAVGEMVSLYLKGQSRWEFFQAKKKLGDGLTVGDLMKYTFTGTEPGKAPGTTKKVYAIVLAHPKDKDAEQTAKCEEAYRRLTQPNTGSAEDFGPEPAEEEYDEFA